MWADRLLCGLLLIAILSVSSVEVSSHDLDLDSSPEIDENNNYEQYPVVDSSVSLDRNKRGWVSVIFTATSMLVKVTSLGLTLGAALTDGCIYYPSICHDRDTIERLDKQIKTKTAQYETLYATSKEMYYSFRETSTNNGYIEYYINTTMQAVETLQQIEESIVLLLELKLPHLSKLAAGGNSSSFESYLKMVVGGLESRLQDLKDMLAQHKQDALVGIAVQYVVEATLGRIVKTFQNAYTQVSSEDIIATANANLWERLDGSEEFTVTSKSGVVEHLSLTKKAFTQMFKNTGKSLRNFGYEVRKWGRINNWKGFKGKLAHTFRGPISKLNKIKGFFTAETRATFVRNYKLGWSETIMTSIGIVADIVTTAIAVKEYQKVSVQMKKARESYQEYYTKLTTEYNKVLADKNEMNNLWSDNIAVFKGLSEPFKDLMLNSSQYTQFSDVVGLSHLPVNTHNALFRTDFNHITTKSLKSKQDVVIAFLTEIGNNMTALQDNLHSRQVVYNHTLAKSEQNVAISTILNDLKSILKFNPSQTVKDYGSQLTEKEMVCNVAILRSDLDEYDFYHLDQFRPKCEISTSTFNHLKSQSASSRKSTLMYNTIMSKMNSGVKSLSTIVDAVHNAYSGVSDASIRSFGHSISDKDILCYMSKHYPSLHSFDLISLDEFRPSCSRVTTHKLLQMEANANKLRSLSQGIKADLKTCTSSKFCPCLTQVAQTHKTTVASVTQVLKQINPHWRPAAHPNYCSPPPTGCGCTHL